MSKGAGTFGEFIARVLSRWRLEQQPTSPMVRLSATDEERIGLAVFKRICDLNEWNDEHSMEINSLVRRFVAESTEGQPAQFVEEQNERRVVHLPSIEHEILMLHVCDDLNYKRIAERLNMPPAAVLRHLTMAYSKLCEAMVATG